MRVEVDVRQVAGRLLGSARLEGGEWEIFDGWLQLASIIESAALNQDHGPTSSEVSK
jgi:hypothetical protein